MNRLPNAPASYDQKDQNDMRRALENAQSVDDNRFTTDETAATALTTRVTSLETSRTTDEGTLGTQGTRITSLETSRTTDESSITSQGNRITTLEAQKWAQKWLTADQTTTLATFTAATGLSIPMLTGETWIIEVEGFALGGAAGIKIRLNAASVSDFGLQSLYNSTTVTAFADQYGASGTPNAACLAITGYFRSLWWLVCSGNCNAVVEIAAATATQTNTLKKGFSMRGFKV